MATDLITEADVDGFRERLDQWGTTLPEGEQAVLRMVLVRAFPPDGGADAGEVEGFAVARDPHSGLPTGKRTHKPYVFTADLGPGLHSLVGLNIGIPPGPCDD
jgi:hypothetical protein